MMLHLSPLRLAKQTCCMPKVISVIYSTKPVHQERLINEKPWISLPRNSNLQLESDETKSFTPPDTVLQNRFNIRNDITTSLHYAKVKAAEAEWKAIEVDYSKLHKQLLMLSKIRLTFLVVVTTMAGYILAPGVFNLQTFVMCSLGTGLISATANSINQFFEVPFDAQMSRTKNRVLVRGHLTPAQVLLFASLSGAAGLSILYFQVNGLTATLGAANLILYTLIYTPMKRVSIINTWVGSIVGAIPPLMGFAGCVGNIAAPGAWIMSGILYAWQFPHFNALSWNLRPDYSRAGYRMMAVTNPKLCRRTALRYTAVLLALSYLSPILDVTHWWFTIASTPLNVYFLYLAWQFNEQSDSATSRKLFRFSLVHLPALMLLMLLSKKYCTNSTENTQSINLADQLESEKNIVNDLTRSFTPSVTQI